MLRSRLVVPAACAAAFLAALDNTVVAVALRSLQSDLGAGVSALQGVVSAYAVALAALLLPAGAAVDALGRRAAFATGVVLFAAASAGCALCTSAGELVAARAVQGAGAALVLPGSLAVLSVAVAPQRRARAVAAWAATGALALALGPVVGGLLVAAAGWRAVFWVNVPVAAVVLLGALAVPGGRDRSARPVDVPGALLAALALGLATYGVVLVGHGDPGRAAVAVGLALVAALALVVVERRSPAPLLTRAAARGLAGPSLAAFAASLAVFLVLVFGSLFLQLVQQREALPAALRLLPLTVALALAALPAARLAARRGPRLPVVAGLLLAAAGLAGLARVLSTGLGDGPFVGLLAMVGLGAGLTAAPVVARSLEVGGQDRTGLAAAVVNAARELGGVVAVAGLGTVVVLQLTSSLTGDLRAAGVPAGTADAVVQAAERGASTEQVLSLSAGKVPLPQLLSLRQVAEDSYVASVRTALLGGAVLLVLAAAAAGRTLPAVPAVPAAPLPDADRVQRRSG